MTSIVKAGVNDYSLLADIGKNTFIQSHGHSASGDIINAYVRQKFSVEIVKEELSDPANIYHILFSDDDPAGYSKIILDAPHPDISVPHVTKLERIYLLKEFYELKLGSSLFTYNLELSRQAGQRGMWLYTWKENERAISFYTSHHFKIIGSYDFRLSATHTNPNHLMFLEY
jgi:ribosomal protein S18 acetylase RimI-like enzyme